MAKRGGGEAHVQYDRQDSSWVQLKGMHIPQRWKKCGEGEAEKEQKRAGMLAVTPSVQLALKQRAEKLTGED